MPARAEKSDAKTYQLGDLPSLNPLHVAKVKATFLRGMRETGLKALSAEKATWME